MGGINVNNRILSLLFSLLLVMSITGLVACESSQPDNQDTPSSEEHVKTESEKTNVNETATKNLEIKKHVPTMERIHNLEDIAMTYYFGQGDLEIAETELFPGIEVENKYDVMEEAFKRASTIDPYHLDSKYSLASVQILNKEIDEALSTYEEILNFDKNHFEAQLMHAVFSKVQRNDEDFETGINNLKKIDSQKAEIYNQKIELVDEMKELSFETEVPDNLSSDHHGFIVLGYALSKDGEMQEPLLERLKVAEEAAKAYPDSKIIVTGGVPKQGVTEADIMFDWLVEHGIDEERIIKEDMATDTIENALFSMEIVDREGLKDLTLITSATHMRRALTLFNEANGMIKTKKPKERDISHVVYYDYEDDDPSMSQAEELVIYRDLMRTSGIWQFPGLQR